jgi:hypothetical protein
MTAAMGLTISAVLVTTLREMSSREMMVMGRAPSASTRLSAEPVI